MTVSDDEFLNPDTDVAINGWTTDTGGTTGLAQSIDELTASDADYIQSPVGPAATAYYETALEDAEEDPDSSTGHIVHYRYRKNITGGSIDLNVALVGGMEQLSANQRTFEGTPFNWVVNANNSLVQDTAVAHSGASSAKLTLLVAGQTLVATTLIGLDGMPVSPSTAYTVSEWLLAATGNWTTRLFVLWYKSDGTVSTVDPDTFVTSGSGVVDLWVLRTGTVMSPSDAAYAAVYIDAPSADVDTAYNLDDFSFQRAEVASWTHTNISDSWTQQDQTLSGPQADLIADYSDLRLRFTPTTVVSDVVPTYVADRASANLNTAVTTVDLVLTGLTVGNYLIVRSAADNSGGGGAARSFALANLVGTAIAAAETFQHNNDPGAASAGTTVNVAVAKITATAGTVRITYGGSVVQACVAEEWSGIHGTAATAVAGTPVGASGVASTNFASVTDTSIALGNVAYAAVAVEAPAADTFTQDADTTNGSWVGLTELGTTSGTADANQSIMGAYKAVTAAGAQTYNPTGSVARDSAGLILELVPAPATVRTQVSWANLEIPFGSIRAFPAQVLAVAAIGAPAISAEQTASPTTVVTVAAIPAPAVDISAPATATVAIVAAVAALGAPVISAGTTVAPAVVSGVGVVSAPAVSAGSKVVPTTVSAVAAVAPPSVVISTPATAAPVSVVGSAAVAAPAISTGQVSQPLEVKVPATISAPSVRTGGTVFASTVVATAAVGTATVAISTPATAAPTPVVGMASVGAPVVTAPSNVTALVSVVAAVAAIALPFVDAGSNVTAVPASVETSAAISAPTVTAPSNASAVPDTVASIAVIGAPAVTAPSNVTVVPEVVSVVASLAPPVVDAQSTATATPTTVAGAVTIGSPVTVVPSTAPHHLSPLGVVLVSDGVRALSLVFDGALTATLVGGDPSGIEVAAVERTLSVVSLGATALQVEGSGSNSVLTVDGESRTVELI